MEVFLQQRPAGLQVLLQKISLISYFRSKLPPLTQRTSLESLGNNFENFHRLLSFVSTFKPKECPKKYTPPLAHSPNLFPRKSLPPNGLQNPQKKKNPLFKSSPTSLKASASCQPPLFLYPICPPNHLWRNNHQKHHYSAASHFSLIRAS